MVVLAVLMATSAFAQDTTRPTISSISPSNNEVNFDANKAITVTFSEAMDPSTINADTFTVFRRTTPASGSYRAVEIDKVVSYSGRTATFNPNYDFSTGQIYGNVFTVTVTTGAKDLAGNSLGQDYIWSFTTGGDAFNTGPSTSQQEQIATQAGSTAPVATQTAAQTTTPSAKNNFWWWIVGAAILLALIAILLVIAANQKQKKVHHARKHTTPFGDVHPVIDLEGIGPVYNKELKAMGIDNTKQLWQADAKEVAKKTGAPLASVISWQNMAELSSVNDIGPQYAELLERSGVHSISDLKKYETGKLLKLIKHKQASLDIKIQGNTPGHDLVANWIHEAKGHQKFSA